MTDSVSHRENYFLSNHGNLPYTRHWNFFQSQPLPAYCGTDWYSLLENSEHRQFGIRHIGKERDVRIKFFRSSSPWLVISMGIRNRKNMPRGLYGVRYESSK